MLASTGNTTAVDGKPVYKELLTTFFRLTKVFCQNKQKESTGKRASKIKRESETERERKRQREKAGLALKMRGMVQPSHPSDIMLCTTLPCVKDACM